MTHVAKLSFQTLLYTCISNCEGKKRVNLYRIEYKNLYNYNLIIKLNMNKKTVKSYNFMYKKDGLF